MTSRISRIALVATLVGATALPALTAHADRGFSGHGGPGFSHGYHGGGRGYWYNGHHDGRWGWWWVLPGAWLLYDRPVYPAYPPVIVQPAPQEPVIVQPAPQPATQNWYYCDSAGAYYPYVQTCPEGWRTVPATPPAPVQPGIPASTGAPQ